MRSPGGCLDDAQVIAWFTSAYKIVGDEIRQSIKGTNEPAAGQSGTQPNQRK